MKKGPRRKLTLTLSNSFHIPHDKYHFAYRGNEEVASKSTGVNDQGEEEVEETIDDDDDDK